MTAELTEWCVTCGVSLGQLDPHHPLSKKRGGKRTVTLCRRCHMRFHEIMGLVLAPSVLHLAAQEANAAKLCEIHPRFIYALPYYLGGKDYEAPGEEGCDG